MIDWFENLFGFRETSPETVKEHIELLDRKLHSKKNGWAIGAPEEPKKPRGSPHNSITKKNCAICAPKGTQ